MSETKTPQPGEYWVSDDGSLIRIVGVKLNGGVIYENRAGFSFQFNSMIQWRHEPRCTGFDWVEPKLLTPGEGYEWVQHDDMIASGDEYQVRGGSKDWHRTSACGIVCKSADTYRRKIKPVETPNDWVEITDRDHKLRHGIDEVMPTDVGFVPVTSKAGCTLKQTGFTAARCRRRDLPAAEYNAMLKKLADQNPPPQSWYDGTPEPCAMCGDVSCDCDCYKYAVEATGCPIESPNDWVEITDRDHKLRAGIDEFRNSHEWAFVLESHGKTAGQAGFLNVRCRRKDLPPVESPYDWVEITDPGHVVRSYIDQVLVSAFGGHRWEYAVMSVGSCLSDLGVSRCRCRRKHLPVPMTLQSVAEVCTSEPVKTPDVVTWGGTVPSAKRVPVRLWRDKESGQIVATMPEDVYCVGDFAVEVFFDADGFYVDGAE